MIQAASSKANRMEETIKRSPKVIMFIEFYPQSIERLERNPVEFLDNLTRLGFSLSVIDEDKRELIPLTDFNKFMDSFPKKGEVIKNLYAVKKEYGNEK